jgi:FKBP-type peptidyl-prolyl cis-trans isomerase
MRHAFEGVGTNPSRPCHDKTGFDAKPVPSTFPPPFNPPMRHLLPALAVFAAITPFALAEDKAPAAPVAPAAEAAKPAEVSPEKKKLFLQAFGWIVAKRSGLEQLEFTEEELTEVIAGAKLGASGKGADFPEKMQPLESEYMAFLQLRSAAAQAKATAKKAESSKGEETAGAAFIKAAAAADKDIVVEPSGLAYKIIDAGKGEKPKPESVVKVNYTGKLTDGTVFDATEQHPDKAPSEFPLNGVIAGWTQGLQKVAKGGKIKLWIPGPLAYGVEGREPKIKPGATLVFDVELVDVKAPAAEAPVDAAPESATAAAAK